MPIFCHLYDRKTKRRLCSCPCSDLETAKLVAICQKETFNLVTTEELFAGYLQGELLFCVNRKKELRKRLTKLNLNEPPYDYPPEPDCG
jgi:hypothetical protein